VYRIFGRLIEPRSGTSVILTKGQYLKIVDWEGKQVADLVAFNSCDRGEKLSTAATIDMCASIRIGRGDFLFSNRYNRMFRVVEDRVGSHDLLHPACSLEMYRAQYCIHSHHPSCQENLEAALREHGIRGEEIPNPVNIFMNVLIDRKGRVHIRTPLSKKGDFILLRAEMNLIVGVTACAVEESRCNGYACTAVQIEVLSEKGV